MALGKMGSEWRSGGQAVATPALAAFEELLVEGDPLEDLGSGLAGIVGRALAGDEVPREEAYRLTESGPGDLAALCRAASVLRDRGRGRDVSFSPKVFIPLTRLCRDFCGYCTFRQAPSEADSLYMSPEEVLAVARAGERLGCTEALFTLGERPEQRYPEAKEWLQRHGYRTTLEYLHDVSQLVLQETSLLPHGNPGTMSRREMEQLKDVNASMGLMVENVSPRLSEVGGPHELAPSKRPRVRIRTAELAGELRIAFTTGILIGIGETREERIESLLVIRDLHRRYGHIQEVIIQNFRAKPDTRMRAHGEPSAVDMAVTIALARLVLGPDMNIQAPPNLTADAYQFYLASGINDWGGVSPVTKDFINPEKAWPMITELKESTEALGFELRERLAIYPEYIVDKPGYLNPIMEDAVRGFIDGDGYVKNEETRW
jgi:FO synthase